MDWVGVIALVQGLLLVGVSFKEVQAKCFKESAYYLVTVSIIFVPVLGRVWGWW